MKCYSSRNELGEATFFFSRSQSLSSFQRITLLQKPVWQSSAVGALWVEPALFCDKTVCIFEQTKRNQRLSQWSHTILQITKLVKRAKYSTVYYRHYYRKLWEHWTQDQTPQQNIKDAIPCRTQNCEICPKSEELDWNMTVSCDWRDELEKCNLIP